jgi:hypothetical protein
MLAGKLEIRALDATERTPMNSRAIMPAVAALTSEETAQRPGGLLASVVAERPGPKITPTPRPPKSPHSCR